jgi:phenylacetate-CoA ligase
MSLLERIYQHSPIPFQTFMLNIKAAELYYERYGKKFKNQYKEFKDNEELSSGDLEEYQNEKLRKLVKHSFETVPYYRNIFDERKLRPHDINSINDLYKLPILTKEDIRTNYQDLISSRVSKRNMRYGHTSGTTGTPLNVVYDINVCVVHHAADWRQKSWGGMDIGDNYASIQGRMICPSHQNKPPFWRKNYINNQLFMSSFHLKKEYLQAYFDKLDKNNIRYIEGYPSTLFTLASYLASTGQKYKMNTVFTSSETLFEFQREIIEEVFQTKVFDFYGMAERTTYATECAMHSGHHINTDYGVTEFLDSNDAPVQKGEMGRIIATSLHNYAFPMIRYQTNDSCSTKVKSCDCGSSFPLMDDVATKNEAIITLPDGRWISPSVLTHPFKPMINIIASQIIQENLHHIRIKIQKNEKYTLSDEKMLLSAFKERVGKDIGLSVEYVEEISKTSSGKFKWVTSRVKPIF